MALLGDLICESPAEVVRDWASPEARRRSDARAEKTQRNVPTTITAAVFRALVATFLPSFERKGENERQRLSSAGVECDRV